jgi:death-on-curing protein
MIASSPSTAAAPELYPVYVALAEGGLAEADFAAWLRPRLKLATGDAVNEPRVRHGR